MRIYYCEGEFFVNRDLAKEAARKSGKGAKVKIAEVTTDKDSVVRMLNDGSDAVSFGEVIYESKRDPRV